MMLKISELRYYTNSRQMLKRADIEPGLRLADYLWTAAVAMTRQNRFPSEDDPEQSELALIPCWDMTNYRGGTITTYSIVKQQNNNMRANSHSVDTSDTEHDHETQASIH